MKRGKTIVAKQKPITSEPITIKQLQLLVTYAGLRGVPLASDKKFRNLAASDPLAPLAGGKKRNSLG